MSQRYTRWHHKRAVTGVPDWLRAVGLKLLGEIDERKQRSGLFQISRSIQLQDGSRIKATITGDVPVVEYHHVTAATENRNFGDEEYYVDSGWLRGSTDDAITDPGDSGIVLDASAAAATYSAAMAVFDPIVFSPTYGGEDAGDSFGLLRTYTDDAERSADADLVTAKLRALRLIGRTTGLMRCLIKGRLGRRLGEDKIEVLDVDTDQFRIDFGVSTIEFVAGMCGVIATPFGFRLLRWSGGDVGCTPLRIPEPLQDAYTAFLSMGHGTHRTAVATYLLAYVDVDESTNASTVSVPGMPSPTVNGWQMSLTRDEAVCTELEVISGAVECTQHLLEFDVTQDEDGVESIDATLSVHASTNYKKAGAPVVWIPTPPPPYEMVRLDHSASASSTAWASVYAFYDENDDIALLNVRNITDSGTPVVNVINDTTTTCCGACTATYEYESETGVEIRMAIECATYADTSGQSSVSKLEISGTAEQQATATEAGAATPTAGTICYQSGAIFFFENCNQLFTGPHNFAQTTLSGSDGAGDLAAIVPFSFVDGAFAVRRRGRQMDGTLETSSDTKGLSGGITNVNLTTVHWTKGYGSTATTTGGGISNTHVDYPDESVRDYKKQANARGIHPFGDIACVSVDESNTDPDDATMPTTWLDEFIDSAGTVEYVSTLAHSWHGQGWMRLGPDELSVAFGGLDPPANDGLFQEYLLLPIGIE